MGRKNFSRPINQGHRAIKRLHLSRASRERSVRAANRERAGGTQPPISLAGIDDPPNACLTRRAVPGTFGCFAAQARVAGEVAWSVPVVHPIALPINDVLEILQP